MGISFVKQSSVKMSKYVYIFNIAINLNPITCVFHKRISFALVLRTKNQKKIKSSKVNQTVMRDRFPSKAPRPPITPNDLKFHRNHYQINQGNQLICKDYSSMLWMQHSPRIWRINRKFILWMKKYAI